MKWLALAVVASVMLLNFAADAHGLAGLLIVSPICWLLGYMAAAADREA